MNFPPIQAYKHLMPYKAFKLLYSQNLTTKPFNPSPRRDKQQNQKCFPSVKKFHITTYMYCNIKRTTNPASKQALKQTQYSLQPVKPLILFISTTLSPTTKNFNFFYFLVFFLIYFLAALGRSHLDVFKFFYWNFSNNIFMV